MDDSKINLVARMPVRSGDWRQARSLLQEQLIFDQGLVRQAVASLAGWAAARYSTGNRTETEALHDHPPPAHCAVHSLR